LDRVALNGRKFRLQVKVKAHPDKQDHRQPKIGRALVESAKPRLPICGDVHAVPGVASLEMAKIAWCLAARINARVLGKPKYRQIIRSKSSYD
jgi:hypothetical protein